MTEELKYIDPAHEQGPGPAKWHTFLRSWREKYLYAFKGHAVILRWLILLILLCFSAYASHYQERLDVAYTGILLALYACSNLLLMLVSPTTLLKNSIKFIIFCFDTVLISLFIYFSRSFDTDLYLIYFFIIFSSALSKKLKESIAIASMFALLYIFLSLNYSKMMTAEILQTPFLIRIPFIFVLTLFYSFLSEQTRVTQDRTTGEKTLNEKLKRELQMVRSQLDKSTRLATTGEMLAGLVHSVNISLYSILEKAELIVKAQTTEDIKRAADKIINEARHCHEMSQRTLHLSTDKSVVYMPLDINQVIAKCGVIVEDILEVSQVDLRMRLTSHMPPIMGDEVQLQQLFLNLIYNARQAMVEYRGSGTLEIQSSLIPGIADDDKIQVFFKDNGPGIAEDVKEKVFDPFFSTYTGNVGLGLTLCREIVEAHQGSIVFTTFPGQGTAFFVQLPAYKEGIKPAVSPEEWAKTPEI